MSQLSDLTPSGIFDTHTFPIPGHIDPLSRFMNAKLEYPCESQIFSHACEEPFPTAPYLALFFGDRQGIYWRLARNLVNTAPGIDFVDKLWDYLKQHNKANLCVRYITVMMEVPGRDDMPTLMGCMHKDGVRIATRLTPIAVDSAGFVHRAGDTTLVYCDPTNCLCDSIGVHKISTGH